MAIDPNTSVKLRKNYWLPGIVDYASDHALYFHAWPQEFETKYGEVFTMAEYMPVLEAEMPAFVRMIWTVIEKQVTECP